MAVHVHINIIPAKVIFILWLGANNILKPRTPTPTEIKTAISENADYLVFMLTLISSGGCGQL